MLAVQSITMNHEELISLCQENGISPMEFLEANLFHLALLCADDTLIAELQGRNAALRETELIKSTLLMDQTAYHISMLINSLPLQLAAVVNYMVKYELMQPDRAAANWTRISELLLEQMPQEEKDERERIMKAVQDAT